MKRSFWLTASLLAACSVTVRPVILSELDAIAHGASAEESKTLVPQAYLRAEQLRQEAEALAASGKNPLSEIKAERSIVAFSRAQILARIVKAQQRLIAEKTKLAQAETEALALEARRATVVSEVTALENQVLVEREVEPIESSRVSSPDRELARKKALKAALTQARLLCVSAELLGTDKATIDARLLAISELETKIDKNLTAVPLNEGIALRSQCQEQLTLVRRPVRAKAPNSEASDVLFTDLSEKGFSPIRDDRGVVVTVPTKTVDSKLAQLGGIAVAHDQTPLIVVVHRAKGEPSATDVPPSWLKQLSDAGVQFLRSESAGSRLAIETGYSPGSAQKNERVEFVFVTRM
jgi:hypothetical protein